MFSAKYEEDSSISSKL